MVALTFTILGIPNVTDSFHAIKKLVFEKKKYTLRDVHEAIKKNWSNLEIMRQHFLNEDKFGNDIDEVDSLCVRITESLSKIAESITNQRGQQFRPSLYSFEFQINPNRPGAMKIEGFEFGATPDGRLAEEDLAHGINPQIGRNTRGLIPTANSITKIDQRKFQGGPIQIDIQPKFLDDKDNAWKFIRDFSTTFFKKGGTQIILNVMDVEKLRDAMDHPEKPEYQNIVIRVTGYASRFVTLNRSYQEEFVERLSKGKI